MGELMGWWAVPALLDAKQGDRPIVLIRWRCVGDREAFRRKAPRNGNRRRADHSA